MVGVFKLNHRHVYGIDDAGMLMFGRVGREVLGTAYCLFCSFCAGSAFIGISIGLNAVSHHVTCTAVFVIVAALISFGLSSIRTLGRIAGLAWLGLICLVVAILVVTFAVGFQDLPAAAPQSGPWDSDFKLFKNPPFTEAISAVSTMCFAYAGGPFFFGMIAEMKEPRHFTRSLMLCQITVTCIYIAVSSVVYYYCGSYVASPALGSAGVHIKKIAYGLALPGLFISATLLSHMPAKYIFVRLLRGSKHLTSNSVTHWSTWIGCTFSVMLAGYLIASGIPVFNELVSLVGALLGTIVSWQPMGCMWLHDNWTRDRSRRNAKWKAMVGLCMFVISMGTFLMVAGTYGSIVAIVDSYKKSGGSAAWSCADNSNSV